MAEQDYDKDFPNLRATGFHRTSDPADYNCIAFAVWDEENWWEPKEQEDVYWPLPIPDVVTIQTYADAFATRHFFRCCNGRPQRGYHKIALYALRETGTGKWVVEHAARLEDGKAPWKSKLGPDEDIEHSLDGLIGPCYGSVVAFFKRPSDPARNPEPPGMFARLFVYACDVVRSFRGRFFPAKPT